MGAFLRKWLEPPEIALEPTPARFRPERREGSGERAGTDDIGMTWSEWKASSLNRLFQEQGVTGEAGRITPTTVRHGEKREG
jgi:hypothetical protein